MRVLVDAMCAEYGGIRTYVENLLDVWPRVFPEDELHVVAGVDCTLPRHPGIQYREIAVEPRLGPLGRPLAQTVHLRRAAAELKPDAVLATLPSTTVLDLGKPTAVVIYDLRHRLRPEQFSRQTRVLRAVSYRRGYALADGFISISQRSLDDLHRLHPSTQAKPGVVAHLGADHVDAWPRGEEQRFAVAFAHQSNKNLDLVLNGWRLVVDQNAERPKLLIVGVGKQRRDEVAAAIAALGLEDEIELAPFLPDEEFQRVFATARLVVFPSDFEGFGLPVAEGMRLGIPVIIGPEPATREVAAGHAIEMPEWTEAALAEAIQRALGVTSSWLEDGRQYAKRYTWEATVRQTRDLLTRIAPGA
ncbi:MAG: glycosyltransferase family 4 protein [Marmoricola sp.]